MSKGKLIVLEGLDGSGKATQAKLLAEHLAAQGVPVQKITFPDYASDSMRWVVAEGIIGGSREYDGRDWLKPQGSATRAQVAAILMRYIENVTK